MGEGRISRLAQTLLVAATFTIVMWGALAFGAVYSWAFLPLAWACAVTGVAALAFVRKPSPNITSLGFALGLIAIVIALQLIPLTPSVLRRVSPSTESFLSVHKVGYRLNVPIDVADDATITAPLRPQPISIAPQKTLRGFLLFAAFATLLLGLVRLFTAVGAMPVVRGLVLFGVALAIFGIVQYRLVWRRDIPPQGLRVLDADVQGGAVRSIH